MNYRVTNCGNNIESAFSRWQYGPAWRAPAGAATAARRRTPRRAPWLGEPAPAPPPCSRCPRRAPSPPPRATPCSSRCTVTNYRCVATCSKQPPPSTHILNQTVVSPVPCRRSILPAARQPADGRVGLVGPLRQHRAAEAKEGRRTRLAAAHPGLRPGSSMRY